MEPLSYDLNTVVQKLSLRNAEKVRVLEVELAVRDAIIENLQAKLQELSGAPEAVVELNGHLPVPESVN